MAAAAAAVGQPLPGAERSTHSSRGGGAGWAGLACDLAVDVDGVQHVQLAQRILQGLGLRGGGQTGGP